LEGPPKGPPTYYIKDTISRENIRFNGVELCKSKGFPLLSDSSRTRQISSPKKRNTGAGWYPDSVKTDALKLWLICGNMRQVSASMNIPYDTLSVWKGSKWWSELSQDIRTEGHLALSHKMQKIADKAMDVTLDRLENGDAVLDQKTGEIKHKPVSMRDAHQVAVSFQDRALKLQHNPQDEAHQATVSDRLAQLADAFSKMAGKTKKIEVLDVSFTEHEESQPAQIGDFSQEADAETGPEIISDLSNESVEDLIYAIPEGWEEGLQAGSPVGEDQAAPPVERPGDADSSTPDRREDHGEPTSQHPR
jgi:hypothetical protein